MKTTSTSRSAFFCPRVLVGFALCSVGLLPALAGLSESVTGTPATTAPAQTLGSWEATGSLATGREYHTATLLPNGKVLVAGGLQHPQRSRERGTVRSGDRDLDDHRQPRHRTLSSHGDVAAQRQGAGRRGLQRQLGALASAELYDPATGTWTATGSLATARYYHTATLLPNGKVLVAGGLRQRRLILASAELYDPASGTWTATGSLNTARDCHTATLLPNGKVLVAGGHDGSDLSRARNCTIRRAGPGRPPAASAPHAIITRRRCCPTARCWSQAGLTTTATLASAELYDPASGTWTATGSLATARDFHTATLLPNGKVLVAGGYSDGGYLASAELYDPASGTWTATGSLATARCVHTATLLPNGKVLVAGGSGGGYLASAELYTSDGGGDLTLVSAASLGRGGFAIDLPLTGPSGVEDRSTLPNNKLTITMTFNNDIASVGGASSTCGSVSGISINGNTVTVKLVDVPHGCNGTNVDVTANDVMDDQGNTLSSATATVGLLLGDANGDRVVNPADRH